MSKLTGNLIANTYKQLLQVGSNNTGLTSTEQTVQDGSGENSALKLSKSAVDINGTFKLNGVAITTNASAINAITDLTGITGLVAVSSGDVYGRTLTAGTGITIGNGDGTEGNPTIAVSLADTTINVAKVSASAATFNDTVSAGFFVGDGSGLVNVPSAEGGTVKFIEAGTGIKITVDGAVSSNIPVSGTILVSADQNFGTVSVSTALAVTGSALFNVVSATSYYGDGSNLTGVTQTSVSNYTVNQLTVVSAASFPDDATLNFGTGNDLQIVHNGLNSVIKESGTGSLFVQSNEIKLTNTGSFSMLTLTDGQDAVFPYGIQVSGTVSATSFIGPTITSINSVISNVSALTSVNAAAITSINTVIDGFDFATSAELAAVSSALATSIATANTRITSVSDYAVALSATLATSIGNSNSAITSINAILGDGSNFATNAELATVSAALATSIATANTRITSVSDFAVALSATMATSIGTANTRITSVSDYAVALSATLATSIGTRLAIANNLSDLNNAGTARTNLGVAIGSDVEAYDPDILKADTADELTAGFSAAAYNAGTQTTGTYTPDVDNGNFQYTINGGAHTLGVPSKNCTMVILYKNNASAGTVTTSGYTKVDGDTISTTDGDEFFFYITRVNDGTTTFSMLTVKALQ